MPWWLVLIVIGLLDGFAAGLFGVSGGIVIVPSLTELNLPPPRGVRDHDGVTIRKFDPYPPRGYVDAPQTWGSNKNARFRTRCHGYGNGRSGGQAI